MTDKFTITATYSRKEILDWAEKGKKKGGSLIKIRNFLDQIFPAWDMDSRTSYMVELILRDSTDPFYPLFQQELDKLNAA